jgi:inorganic phosphate transporter, PiT family
VPEYALVAVVVILSLVFTYTNGLQDGSSVTAGLIFCRVLKPVPAVLLVACFEFAGAMFGGSAVASAVRSITPVSENAHLLPTLAAGLSAAIAWNYLAKFLKMPSSSTHALFGGLLGAFLAAPGGAANIIWGTVNLFHPTGFGRIVVSLFTSPVLGFVLGYILINVMTLALVRATTEANRWLKLGQTVTVSLLAFGHGANDPQKTMGIILMALHASGIYRSEEIPLWVRVSTGLSIALGVILLAPGIAKRVGSGIYKLRILHGFVSQATSGVLVVASSLTGCPVSSSQVISSAVMGVGSGEHFKDVHWLVARDILISWFLTIPCAGLCAYVLYFCGFRFLDMFIKAGT